MSIAHLCLDPWLKIIDFPPCNFVVSQRRSLGKHHFTPAPCGQDHLKKVPPPDRIHSLMCSFICRRSHVHSIPVRASVLSQSGSPAYIFCGASGGPLLSATPILVMGYRFFITLKPPFPLHCSYIYSTTLLITYSTSFPYNYSGSRVGLGLYPGLVGPP